jgi:uncharacterized paraquat-inducible protein A
MIITHRVEGYDVVCGNCEYRFDEDEVPASYDNAGEATCPKCHTTAKLGVRNETRSV